ncbi:MAG: hypothetical protein JW746_09795 [Candidatus Krumholzibacteriota bacterium]|nr:hypothetical protein [Candidatus Krumholzibacteriota bacterium]
MSIAAIDFETANSNRSSACAIGVALIDDLCISNVKHWLIRPSELFFDPFNIMIHGITESDVEDKPELNELWPEIYEFLKDRLIIAHNASFDMSVLRYAFDEYDMDYPTAEYSCTRIISQKQWMGMKSYSLDTVAEHLGISFLHHKADEDAVASAKIAIQAMKENGVNNIHDLSSKLEFAIGKIFPGGYQRARLRTYGYYSLKPDDIVPEGSDFDTDHPFFNKMVVFTGTLSSMTRKEAMQKIVNLGGHCHNGVTVETNYLVMGLQDYRKLKDGKKSSKMKKAEKLISERRNLEMIDEAEFLQLL